MENNDFQKDVNNVNKNANQSNNQNVQKKQKNEKRKTVILIVILLILVLVAGIFGGILISGNGDKVTNIINQGEEKKEENKASKKVDESKPWVYDADYLKEKEEKIKNNEDKTLTFKSSEEIKMPYININSDDAKIVNEELRVMAEKAYNEFGKPLKITDVATNKVTTNEWSFTITSYDYETYINGDILSIVIEKGTIAVPGDGSKSYITYNFDLNTMKIVDFNDIYTSYGFKSISDFYEKKNIELKNSEIKGEGLSPEWTQWDAERFFIKDNMINIVVPGPANSECIISINPNVKELAQNTNTKVENAQNDEYSKAVAEIKKCLKDSEWIKNNVSLEYGDTFPENLPQKHTFIIVKGNTSVPIVIVKAERQERNNAGIYCNI